jgi:multiple sugar transport system substrate-binding protein
MKRVLAVLMATFLLVGAVTLSAQTTVNSMAMSAMNFTDETLAGLKALGINLVHQENPYEGYREKLLADWSAGASSYDIVAVSDEWIADFVTPGYLTPLDVYFKKAPSSWELSDFFETPINLVARYPQGSGQLYTVPYLTFSLELAYNSKMFKDAGIVDAKGEAKPPKTLAEFTDDCKKLTNPAKNLYAFAPLYLNGETVTIQYEHWHRVFTGLGGVLDANNKPQVGNSDSVEALKFMKSILKYSPPGALNYRDFEVTQALKTGKVAMIFIWGAFGGDLSNSKDNPMAPYIKFAATPASPKTGKPAPMGAAWGWGIPKYAQNKDISWKAIQYLTSKDVLSKELKHLATTYGAGPTRKSVFTSQQAMSSPWLVVQGQILPFTGYRPHLSEWTQISAIISDEVSAALSGTKDEKSAMDEAQQRIEGLFN